MSCFAYSVTHVGGGPTVACAAVRCDGSIYNFNVVSGGTVNLDCIQDGEIYATGSPANQANFDLYIQIIQNAPCDCIEIDSLSKVDPTTSSSNDGSVTINTSGLGTGTKEYSKDNVNWQLSNVFNGLDEGAYTFYVRQGECSDSMGTVLTAQCQVSISSINILKASNPTSANGQITVSATGSGVLSYSLNGVSWQSSNVLGGLLPGNYVVYVRNVIAGIPCITTQNVVVGFNLDGGSGCATYRLVHNNGAGPAVSGTARNCEGNIYVWNCPAGGSVDLPCTQKGEIFPYNQSEFQTYVSIQNLGDCSPVVVCNVTINSVTPTNSATNISNDGAINVAATGTGVLTYKLNSGSYQSSNIFSGLAPGAYTVTVRNTMPNGSFCEASQNVNVGFTTIACDLVLGTIITSDDGPTGTITVVNYVGTLGQPVEYRIGAGAWQSSNVFAGQSFGTKNVQIRYANYPSCTANRNVELTDSTPCDVAISVSVTHEQSKYGNDGIINASATGTNGPFEFKLDAGPFQSSGVFNNLAPGSYLVTVRDSDLCEDSRTVEVLRYKKAVVEYPLPNGLRVVPISGPPYNTGLQNFDNRLFADMRFAGKSICKFFQPYPANEVLTIQWRSSYAAHAVQVFNNNNQLQLSLTPVKKASYVNQTEVLSAQFSNAGAGKTQVYFLGGLPNYFEIGQDITISGVVSLNGTYEIEDIVPGTGQALGYEVLIINKNYTSGTDPLTGSVSVVYSIEDFDVWEVVLDMALLLAGGKYYLKWIGTDPLFTSYVAQSDPFEIVNDTSDIIAFAYRNFDNAFKIDYYTSIVHKLHAEGELLFTSPGGESETMDDSRGRKINLRDVMTRQLELTIVDAPFYVLEKIALALAHDECLINGVSYRKTDQPKIEFNDSVDMLGTLRCNVQQVEYLAENEDDAGDVDTGTLLQVGDNEVMGLEP